jgi:uncharacterized repeat protein (TIGR03803 family)
MKSLFLVLILILGDLTASAQGVSELWATSELGGPAGNGAIMKMDLTGSGITSVYDFSSPFPGTFPVNFMQASNGKLYGTTLWGGSFNKGLLYCYNPLNTDYVLLNSFNCGSALGTSNSCYPGAVMEAANGKLYGVTYKGGTNDLGLIYSFDLNTSTYNAVFSFSGANGTGPSGNLIIATDGKIYGTTDEGGANNAGVLFSLDTATNTFTKLFDFGGLNGINQRAPGYVGHPGSLIEASNGKLYGTLYGGGANTGGVLFCYDRITNNYSVAFDYTSITGGGPIGAIIQASDGKIYGRTIAGALNSGGTIYSFDPVTNICNPLFNSYFNSSSGALIEGPGGELFGTTGAVTGSILFSYNISTNVFNSLLDFSSFGGGLAPAGQIAYHPNGKIYGITSMMAGGASSGYLYSFELATTTLTLLFEFDDINNQNQNGVSPRSIFKSADDKIYGITRQGGLSDSGILFSYDPALSNYLKHFDFNTSLNGKQPRGILHPANNGKLYGVTMTGGINNAGVLFSVDPSNYAFQKLYDFQITSGYLAWSGVIQASNGKLYGMTCSGGDNGGPYPNDGGVIYSFDISTNTYSKLYDFYFTNTTNVSGYTPIGGLIQATNGLLYGMTQYGGASGGVSGIGAGVIFSFNPSTNVFNKIFDFGGESGERPWSDLMQASDGKLYGLTPEGGANTVSGIGAGVLFSLDPATNTYTKLYDFKRDGSGYFPAGNLVEALDGKFYGTTFVTGTNGSGYGGIFSFDPVTATYTNLYNCVPGTGTNPYGKLTLGSDGKIYGKTRYGGTTAGVIFSFDPVTNAYTKLSNDGIVGPLISASRNAGPLSPVNVTSTESNDAGGGTLEIPVSGIGTSVASTVFCAGPTFNVSYKIGYTSFFNSGNTFIAQLSDSTGSFSSPTDIGSVTSIASGTIQATIPSTIPTGSEYRIRVVSTNPIMTGTPNGRNLRVGTAVVTASGNTTFCSGNTVVLTSTVGNSYLWNTGATTRSISVATSGSYSVTVAGCGTSAPLPVVVIPGVAITTQPVPQTVAAGDTAFFNVTATGIGLTYQWKKGNTNLINGTRISGATSDSLSISFISASDASNYRCLITASSGCARTTANAALTVINAAPVISSQPVAPAIIPCETGAVSLTVAATGSGLSYQWYKGVNSLSNGGNISGATTPTLTISSLTVSDAAAYNVVVTNSLGSATSNSVNLTVNARVVITAQPVLQVVCVSNTVNMTVGAIGAGLVYKWRKGSVFLADITNASGSVISGSQTATLTISNAQLSDAATNYNCQVVGTCNTIISSNAAIIVGAPARPAPIVVSGGVNTGNVICPAGDSKTCSVNTVLGASVYTWSVPPGTIGVSINGGGSTGTGQSITVAFGQAFTASSVVLSVVASNVCGTSAARTVTFTNGRPPQPSAITGGSTSVCPGSLVSGYNVLDAGLTYNWSVTGNSVVTGSGSTASVAFGTLFPATLSVMANNGCGASLPRTLIINQSTGGSCAVVMILNVYLQGLYIGGGIMQSPLYNTDPVSHPDPTIADSIIVELRNQFFPNNVVSSVTTMLHTDGHGIVTFPGISNGTYWLVIKHRNSLETWSKFPVTLAPVCSYSFSDSPEWKN